MATRRPGDRAFRPSTEGLETRKLLSKTVTGTDVDGDTWELRLIGMGDLSVTNQPDSTGMPVPLGEPAQINEILIGGTDPTQSRLVGVVTKSAGGDGRVFFQQMQQFNGASVGVVAQAGIHVIDMPDFWLGRTSTDPTTTGTPAASLVIPDGVNTLRFGGADTTFTPEGGTPLNQNGRNDELVVALGLPRTWGTSIIIDKSITDAQAGQGTTAATQDGVQFSVVGRVNTFEANEIVGNADVPYAPLATIGGTQLFASDGSESSAISQFVGQVQGQFGYVRVGGNATNFTVETNDRLANLYIGGETDNILVVTPQGSRNISFGKGMDNVTILTHSIMSLQANRGAINSTVVSERPIGLFGTGGDVIDTQVLSGYDLQLDRAFQTQTLPPFPPRVQAGGAINQVLISGDIIDSVFAASVDPVDGTFGNSNDLVLPISAIHAKLGGTITNTNITPDVPDTAFFADKVKLQHGPVIPPTVPEAPFPNPGVKPSGPRIANVLLPTDEARRRRFPNAALAHLSQRRFGLAAAPRQSNGG